MEKTLMINDGLRDVVGEQFDPVAAVDELGNPSKVRPPGVDREATNTALLYVACVKSDTDARPEEIVEAADIDPGAFVEAAHVFADQLDVDTTAVKASVRLPECLRTLSAPEAAHKRAVEFMETWRLSADLSDYEPVGVLGAVIYAAGLAEDWYVTQPDLTKRLPGMISTNRLSTRFSDLESQLDESIESSRGMISDERLLDELTQLADELGHAPDPADMDRRGSYLYTLYERRFDSWDNALERAGVAGVEDDDGADADEEQIPSRERCLEVLRRLDDENDADLHPLQVDLADDVPFTQLAILEHWESWEDAVEAATREATEDGDDSTAPEQREQDVKDAGERAADEESRRDFTSGDGGSGDTTEMSTDATSHEEPDTTDSDTDDAADREELPINPRAGLTIAVQKPLTEAARDLAEEHWGASTDLREAIAAVRAADVYYKTDSSGTPAPGSVAFRQLIAQELAAKDWDVHVKRTRADVPFESISRADDACIVDGEMCANAVDPDERVAIQFTFANTDRVRRNMNKLEKLIDASSIELGVVVTATHDLAKEMPTKTSHHEKVLEEHRAATEQFRRRVRSFTDADLNDDALDYSGPCIVSIGVEFANSFVGNTGQTDLDDF